jgi:hypothetical protein
MIEAGSAVQKLETSVLRPAADDIAKCFDLAHPHDDCVKLVLKPATAEMMRARPTMAVRARKRIRAFSDVGLMAAG